MAKTLKQKRQIKHLRVRTKIFGTEARPRLNVFKSNKAMYAQIINDDNGKTLVSVSSKSLKLNNNNIESSKKIGTKIGELAKAAGIETVVFDRGGYIYHGKVKALADAAREAGLKF